MSQQYSYWMITVSSNPQEESKILSVTFPKVKYQTKVEGILFVLYRYSSPRKDRKAKKEGGGGI